MAGLQTAPGSGLDYELPVAFEVTRVSASDLVTGHELLDKMQAEQARLLDTAEVLMADRGYDDSALLVKFGFERNFIRGLAKMKLRCNLALCVMLALAVGSTREKKQERMRSLVRAV